MGRRWLWPVNGLAALLTMAAAIAGALLAPPLRGRTAPSLPEAPYPSLS
jgi:hypothetical protein